MNKQLFGVYKVVHGVRSGEPLHTSPVLSDALNKLLEYQTGTQSRFEVAIVEPAIVNTTHHGKRSTLGTIGHCLKALILACFAVVYVLFVMIPPDKSSN